MLTSVLSALPTAAAMALLCYSPYAVSLWAEGRRLPLVRHAALYTLTGAFLMLFYVTILWTGLPGDLSRVARVLNLLPFAWVANPYTMGPAHMAAQLLLNIVMFLPFGALLPVAFRRLRRFPAAALACLCLTLAVETAQYFIGRCADVDDVLLNALGGMAGYALFARLQSAFGRSAWFAALCGTAPEDAAAPGATAVVAERW